MAIVPERRWLSVNVVSFQLLDMFCFLAALEEKELLLSGIFVLLF